MESIHNSRKSIIIALIISLLFHTSVIFYILLQKNIPQNLPTQTLPIKKVQQPVEKQEPWANTKTGQNRYGAPVLFKNSPPQPPVNIIQKEEPATANEPTSPDTKHNLEKHIDLPQPDAIVSAAPQKQEPTTLRPTIAKKRSRAPQQSSQPQQQIIPRETQHSYAPSNQKKLPTLAQLTQGFMNRVKDEGGQHLVSMHGPKKGLPSAQQMKYERYLQKLNSCITNSFAIHSKEFHSSKPIEDDISVIMAINRNGTLHHLSLKQSSGNKALDAFILSVIYDARSSFPPLPDYLPDDPLAIIFSMATKTKERSAISITLR